MIRTLAKVTAAVLILTLLASSGAFLYLFRSLPKVRGTEEVAGISASVEIVRDRDAVPHIYAATRADALFGLGYVHAQDRLWQMEFQRRIGFGRLSEVLGAAALPQDRFLRTVGFGRAAVSAWEHLPADSRALIDAYVAGVNAFISTHHGSRLPPEFTLLRFEPEPWSGADVLAWVKMMAWDLSANYSLELLRHDLAAKVGPERMRELMPPPAADALSILAPDLIAPYTKIPPHVPRPAHTTNTTNGSSASALLRTSSLSALATLFTPDAADGIGSNNWVVDGTMTASGRPMLANDPHLAAKVPSLWYLAHLHFGEEDLIGATLPGTPAVAIGRNRHIAWGETNVAADVEDLYVEHLDPSGRTAEFQGRQEPLRFIQETIRVKGAAPVTVDVRVSRHGPLVSDAINAISAAPEDTRDRPPLEPLAFRWTALDDEDLTVAAFLKLNAAHDWNAFTAALRAFAVPAQNFVYADVDGHIGYYLPGRIPIRTSGDGTVPSEGWTGAAEWQGFIPFEELPHAYDPPQHFIVTANNSPVPAGYPYFISAEYPEPYRAQRITELLQGRRGLAADDFRRIQADTRSLSAATLVPLLLQHLRPQTETERAAVDLLRRWNFDASGNSAAHAVFQSWFLQLPPAIAGDELGADLLKAYQKRFSNVTRFTASVLTQGENRWCDDVRTGTSEGCDEIVTRALRDGLARMSALQGPNFSRWRWDAVHVAAFPHQGLDSVPGLHWLLSRSMPNGGDFSTVNVGAVNTDLSFAETDIPGYRQIVDLSPKNDSRFLDAVGQSGHVLSPHYDDALADWHDVRHRPMQTDRRLIQKDAIGTLTLHPRQQ
jgi:penicillin amidase